MWVAFLKGINVGGHHKVPMAKLKQLMVGLGCTQVSTLLNSGNIIFDYPTKSKKNLEHWLEQELSTSFDFNIPVLIRSGQQVLDLIHLDPFSEVAVNKDIRIYVTFLMKQVNSPDNLIDQQFHDGFKILSTTSLEVFSVLDLAQTQTVKGMDVLGRHFGNNITTRNWNTIIKCGAILQKLLIS